MARPRKPDHDKLVPVTMNLNQEMFAAICRAARRHDMKPAVYLRALILQRFKNFKTTDAAVFSTL
jgi:hypothetical protein